jgi:hypothetical protein
MIRDMTNFRTGSSPDNPYLVHAFSGPHGVLVPGDTFHAGVQASLMVDYLARPVWVQLADGDKNPVYLVRLGAHSEQSNQERQRGIVWLPCHVQER